MLPKQVPAGVRCVHEEHPVDAITDCLPGSCYLIMTHHHGMDLQLAEAALQRGDGRYIGVLGFVIGYWQKV
jgi:xanthine/CO dehydrogenase XdhC/CoxF family maturation factor